MTKISSECTTILCDGTLNSYPRPFHQIFTTHGLEINRQISLFWAVADGKATAHYRKFFRRVISKIGKNWEHAEIFSDFDRAINAAEKTESPHRFHKGCYFLSTRAVYRQIRQLGLSVPYKEDERLRLFTS